jgi:hypothetical protein
LGAGLEGLFKKARQLVEKLIKKLYSYSKNATNTVHASHFSVQRVKNMRQLLSLLRQKNFQLVGKTFALVKYSIQRAKRHRYRSSEDLTGTPHRGLVTLVKNLFGFLYTLVGFLVSFSEKRATSQKNIQFFKTAFNRYSGCQALKLSTGRFSRVSFIPRGGMGLDDFEAASKRVEEILRNETPLNRREGHVHSDTAKKFFGKIKSLRERGFSFIQLCGAFEKAGMLPEKSNPYSLRQAFLRETARRAKAEELLKAVKDTALEKTAAPSAKANMPDSTPAAKTTAARNNQARVPDKEAVEKEWIRKQTSTTVETGLGTIIKNSDGSFDYD